MKKTAHAKKPLSLATQTIRTLEATALHAVVGGQRADTVDDCNRPSGRQNQVCTVPTLTQK